MHGHESIMCEYYCIEFIKYMLAGKVSLDYTRLFSRNEYKRNYKIIHKYFKDKYVKFQIRLTKINETRNFLLEEIKHNNLMNEKHKNTCKYLNYVKHLLIVASIVSYCVLIFAFASLVYVFLVLEVLQVEVKICAITAGIKKYKLIINKKKRKHDKIVLLGKTKLDTNS